MQVIAYITTLSNAFYIDRIGTRFSIFFYDSGPLPGYILFNSANSRGDLLRLIAAIPYPNSNVGTWNLLGYGYHTTNYIISCTYCVFLRLILKRMDKNGLITVIFVICQWFSFSAANWTNTFVLTQPQGWRNFSTIVVFIGITNTE
jgi:hypothetical protein